jgi:NADPH:quinone reductase-like Zn-dependent oxidoreductase
MAEKNDFDRYLLALRKSSIDEKTEHTDRAALQALLQALADNSTSGVAVQHEPSLRPPVRRARQHLERIAQLFQAGAIRPPEIKLYRLSEAADAHRLSESRHFRGKLVFQVR